MPTYFEFDVSLQGIQPRIWRRFLLRRTSTFADLHRAIQDAFDWQDYHLWEFRVPEDSQSSIAGIPDDQYGRDVPDAREVRLDSYFSGRRKAEWCEYLYDFGDDWRHEVKLVRAVSVPEDFRRRLLGGERACPPEDCGSVPGYERMAHFVATGLDLYEDPGVDLANWLGGWKPEVFDLEATAERFARGRRRGGRR